MDQQKENCGSAQNEAAEIPPGEKKEEKDLESKILYPICVTALTALLPFWVIVFFDLYNKSHLAYYKVFDAQLSYSFDTIMSKYLISGSVFLAVIICGILVCQVGHEYYLWWKCKSDLKKRVREIKKCPEICRFNKVCQSMCESEREKLYADKKLKAGKWLTKIFAFIFLFSVAVFAYLGSMVGLNFNELGFDGLQIFQYITMWLTFNILCWGFFTWLLDDKKQKSYCLLWLFLFPFLFAVFSVYLNIDWKELLVWDSLWMAIAVIASGAIFLFCLDLFRLFEKEIWEKIAEKTSQYFKRNVNDLKLVRFLCMITFCTVSMLVLLFLISQGSHRKAAYSVVYDAQESSGIIGISVYEDDSRMIVIPAREASEENSVRYEVIEELAEDENGKLIPIYTHRYIDKTEVLIKRVPNNQIDWKNRLGTK